MQRRAKADPPGTGVAAGDVDLLASSSLPRKSNKKNAPKSKYQTVKSICCWITAFAVGTLLFSDYFTPNPNVMGPHNEFKAAAKSKEAPTKSKAVPAEPTTTARKAESTTATTESTAPKPTTTKSATSIGSGSDVNYHIIFSTSCSVFQDWQSYVFFHQALVTKQPGTVTRIVSGCKEEDELAARKVFQERIEPMAAPGKFRIHFTPDFATVKPGVTFPYFNKPFGTKHWLEHVMGYPDKPVDDDAIVVLMDPDQLFLRPFENNDFSNEQWIHLNKGEAPRTRIEHGYPMGQLYGFGNQWKTKVNMTHISPNGHSPVDDLTSHQSHHYPVSFVVYFRSDAMQCENERTGHIRTLLYSTLHACVSVVTPLLMLILMLFVVVIVFSGWTTVYCHGTRHVYDCRQVV
jgi:hypothetical protein